MYKCVLCKKEMSKLSEDIRCPYCGSRIFVKVRPKKIIRVRAR